jgi:HrpA-like RNA helicase
MIEALPIVQYRDQILDAVRFHPVVVVTAETGAGKSTQVPQFLADAGYRVVVTQPRRLAARSLAERVAEEVGCPLGDRVGFRTAEKRADSGRTQILYITDGLQLVRELAKRSAGNAETILVLDEVHEWNLNMEVLVAWIRAQEGRVKTVLMSATLDVERLSTYFEGCPILDVPGRLFPVERREAPAQDLIATIVDLTRVGRNVLVFLPGKREIGEAIEALQALVDTRTVLLLPLHGELTPAEQALCFATPPPGVCKIVIATNVAQTSITIPDIDAVVDSGEERRVEVVDGIDGLYLRPVSQADCNQRAGRAGRTRAGIYVLCSDFPLAERQSFPVAEILRTRLDQVVLRLAIHGFDASVLAFFHQPSKQAIDDAHTALIALGAMEAGGTVTQIGRRMAKLPVRVELARMLVEAEQRGVLEPVATIAACLEVGDIRSRDAEWTQLTAETKSDLLAVLDVFRAANKNLKKLEDIGVFRRNFFRAVEIRRRILDLLSSAKLPAPLHLSAGIRQEILLSCLAGMIQRVYSRAGFNRYSDERGGTRELSRESVLSSSPDMIVGVPFDLSVKGRTLHLIGMASAVTCDLIRKIAPHQLRLEAGIDPEYRPVHDQVWSTTRVYLCGRQISEASVADPAHPQAAELFRRWLAQELFADKSWEPTAFTSLIEAHRRARKQRVELNARAGSTVFPIFDYDQLTSWLLGRLQGARRAGEIPPEALNLAPLDPARVAEIEAKPRKRPSERVLDLGVGGLGVAERRVGGLSVGGLSGSSLETRSVRAIEQPRVANPTVDDLKARWNRR